MTKMAWRVWEGWAQLDNLSLHGCQVKGMCLNMTSVIVPVLNEEEILKENFRQLEQLGRHAEIIFVDGGSCDGTVEVASKLGRVLKWQEGRAQQMNHGAKEAKGDMLLFLHADSFLGEDAIHSANACVKDGAIGGCFTQRLNNERAIYRMIEGIGNRRARRKKIFYGDQGIFVKKDMFLSLEGFPEVPVMEDVLFSKALRKSGRVEVLDELIHVSTRRWERDGFFKTNLCYSIICLLFSLHVPLSIIKRFCKDAR